jgi:hypothetical protein
MVIWKTDKIGTYCDGVTWHTVGLSNDGNWHIIGCIYLRYMIKTVWCSCSEVAILAYTFHYPQSIANFSWVCTVPECLAVPVSAHPAALSVTALSVIALSVTTLPVSAAIALTCTTCKTFYKPTTLRCHSCCLRRSFPTAHSLYQQAVFFAAQYLFCNSVNLSSGSW